MPQLVHLLLLLVANTVTWLGIFILLIRTVWSMLFNTTTIESWEIERHETLVRRARVLGGFLEGPGGVKIRIRKQEYPYDIGLFSNIVHSMGDSINVSVCLLPSACQAIWLTISQIFSWFWPFASTPDRRNGWSFETNEFEGMPKQKVNNFLEKSDHLPQTQV